MNLEGLDLSFEGMLQLQSLDHPDIALFSTPLGGSNYLFWSRSMKMALVAMNKFCFINGKFEKPEEGSIFEKWNRVNCMITLWILNSISKEIVDALLYTTMLYQLQREIPSISQGI